MVETIKAKNRKMNECDIIAIAAISIGNNYDSQIH